MSVMNISTIKLIPAFCGILSLTLFGCAGESDSNGDSGQNDGADSAIVLDNGVGLGFGDVLTMEEAHYQVPSPNEVFEIIRTSNLEYKDGLVSTESSTYSGVKSQSLNFGRVIADIAYTSSFEKYQESISNFDNLRKMGNDLGISYVFDEILVDRIKNNMSNADSLVMISNSSYQKIVSMLEDNEKGEVLALIVAGGFIESIYLISNLVDEYDAENETVQRLADQKYTYENVVGYLSRYEEDPNIASTITDLETLGTIFEGIDVASNEGSSVKSEGGKTVLGGSKLEMSKEQFDLLKEKSTALRNTISGTAE